MAANRLPEITLCYDACLLLPRRDVPPEPVWHEREAEDEGQLGAVRRPRIQLQYRVNKRKLR